MSFAPSTKEDDSSTSSSSSSFIKSFRSAWKKTKFRRWRRTMDLEKARKDNMEEVQETPETIEAKEEAQNSDCVCVRFSEVPQAAAMPTASRSQEIQVMNPRANFQVDYVSYLIPCLKEIFSCSFYWGKMDRYEAEALLANKPEGSFLLRDSAQDNYVFSVSFRRYSRSLHARIEETQHKFSFDCHDPGVHASRSIRGLLDYYKDPLSCMFFEPMLLFPVLRKKPFSLQELSRTVICDSTSYDGISQLPIPKTLKSFLREYHYKHKVDSRALELSPAVLNPQSPVAL